MIYSIYLHRKGVPAAWIPLTLSYRLFQSAIKHRVDECKFLQVSQHWCVHE